MCATAATPSPQPGKTVRPPECQGGRKGEGLWCQACCRAPVGWGASTGGKGAGNGQRDVVVGEKTGNEIAVMSRANIKNGDFITVIWRRRGAGIVDNTYCQVLFFGNFQILRRGCAKAAAAKKGIRAAL
nr:hypothetical protein [uncultured Janthinobacterium sp.]